MSRIIFDPDEYAEFINDHRHEIHGLYKDIYYIDGPWNGLVGAIRRVEERYDVDLDSESWDHDIFEDIINANFS